MNLIAPPASGPTSRYLLSASRAKTPWRSSARPIRSANRSTSAFSSAGLRAGYPPAMSAPPLSTSTSTAGASSREFRSKLRSFDPVIRRDRRQSRAAGRKHEQRGSHRCRTAGPRGRRGADGDHAVVFGRRRPRAVHVRHRRRAAARHARQRRRRRERSSIARGDFVGTDRFTFRVDDGAASSALATMSIVVQHYPGAAGRRAHRSK